VARDGLHPWQTSAASGRSKLHNSAAGAAATRPAAQALAEAGLNSFRFDFAGNGTSEGVMRFANFQGEVSDVACAKRLLEAEFGQAVVGLLGGRAATASGLFSVWLCFRCADCQASLATVYGMLHGVLPRRLSDGAPHHAFGGHYEVACRARTEEPRRPMKSAPPPPRGRRLDRRLLRCAHGCALLCAATAAGHSKGGDVVILYAAKHGDIPRVVNVAGR
jgi:hypothetical protein